VATSALERLAHLLLDGFQADVVDQHIQRMAHRRVAAVAQPDCPERRSMVAFIAG
jgi:hypothetical protein